HQFRFGIVEQIEVLEDGVGGALIPGVSQAHLGGNRYHEMSRQQSPELPSVLEMLDQGLRAPLHQHVNRVYPRIDQIRQDKIDNPVFASKWYSRFCPIPGQRMQAGSLPPSHYQRKRPHLLEPEFPISNSIRATRVTASAGQE